MKQFDHVIIGFGKAGKTLACALAASGQKTALVERSELMYGGSCINVACIPTKSFENHARLSELQGGDFKAKADRYREAVEKKRALTASLRQKNYSKAVNAGVAVFTGDASFLDSHRIQVSFPDGTTEDISGERIYINTGSRPFVPPIEGLADSRYSYTSEGMMEMEELPRRLTIIGGGYIGLEFGSIFANFGSQVTIIQDGEVFIPREDREVAGVVLESLTERGIRVIRGAAVRSVKDLEDHAVLTLETKDGPESLEADRILVATGRRPNVADLNLEAAKVALNSRGAIQVDEHLRTSVPHIWAMGDVAGGLQFTYISLDDFRIVKSQLMGDGSRTTKNRGAIPYSVFLDPPLSRVGLSKEEALQRGGNIKVARLAVAAIPKAQLMGRPTGILKAIVDGDTGLILGAHFFCAESHEMINLIKLAMDSRIPYTVLRDGIYNHPTMSESFNELFGTI